MRRRYTVAVVFAVLLLAASAGVAAGQEDSVSLKWKYDANGGVPSSPTVVDGTVYFGTHTEGNGSVYALDAETGDVLWEFTTGGPVVASPTVVDGVLYIGSEDRRLYALDARTGEEVWNHTAKGRAFSPTVWNHTVYFHSTNGEPTSTNYNNATVYALDADTGERLWEYSTDRQMSSAPTVTDGVVYIGSFDSNLYALDATTGERMWSYSVGPTLFDSVTGSPTVFEGKVYVGAPGPGENDTFYALDGENRTVVWNFTTDSFLFYSPTAADGKVYVANENSVYALDADDGSVVWNRTTGYGPSSPPTVAGDRLYIGADDSSLPNPEGGALYSFDADTGKQVLNYTTNSIVSGAIVLDGVVYFGVGGIGSDGAVYALETTHNASSDGSRVLLGTLGHHDSWNGGVEPKDTFDGNDSQSEGDGKGSSGATDSPLDGFSTVATVAAVLALAVAKVLYERA